MFGKLQTKVTILYAALFACSLLLMALSVAPIVVENAIRSTKAELTSSRIVFDRIFMMKTRELQGNAEMLAKDFGFATAVATADDATIASALENLRARRGVSLALLVTADHRILGEGAQGLSADNRTALLRALDDSDRAAGMMQIGGVPYQTISTPVMAPQPIGWLVLANRMDRVQMKGFEHLSAIPLEARLLKQGADGRWVDVADPKSHDAAAVDAFVRSASEAFFETPRRLDAPQGDSFALVSRLKSLSDGAPTLLLLRYPLAKALEPYGPMMLALGALGLVCLLALIAGSFALARSITRPIALLDTAVSALGDGDRSEVQITSGDEIGRLAANFNIMSAAIVDREQRITDMARRDIESGLPNSAALQNEIARLRAEGGMAVIALGIERLDVVRNAIGYELLSQLMKELAATVALSCKDVVCARVSTGRLALAAPTSDAETAWRLAQDLMAGLSGPFSLGGTTVDLGFAFGLRFVDPEETSISDNRVLEHANIAVDQALAARKRLAAFDEAAYGDPASNLSLMSELAAARDNGELTVSYQPKLDLRSGKIAGFEALCRWRHATRGPISPDLFVVMAEETGNIEALTHWVLSRVLQDQQDLRAHGFHQPIAVNFSGQILGDRAFAELALQDIRAKGGDIALEITETAVIANPEEALSVVELFERAGVAVSIDDYGSGLSSLAYLKRIHAQELKIDKAFVLLIDQNPKDRLLVKSTIDLAHGLGMKVVAEGVETAEAIALLVGMGCDYAQGYHVARPMPLEDLKAFLANVEEATPSQARSA